MNFIVFKGAKIQKNDRNTRIKDSLCELNILCIFTYQTFILHSTIDIKLSAAGKKYGREWIFRKVSLDIKAGQKIAILGLNGSGKSTLLQALTGYLTLNEGGLTYSENDAQIDPEQHYKLISLASPYLELVEDFTLEEQIRHAAVYKPFLKGLNTERVVDLSGLAAHKNKYIKLFSSGMKQRLKLTLAILADVPVLLLDEPTTNLDATVIDWYKQMIAQYASKKTIIVCSNSIKDEYDFCNKVITMEDFK
jgi:ABC-type multidrug transport system ATPase subunit